jgi:hypothetical protein
VEEGWSCTRTSPSQCSRGGTGSGKHPADPSVHPDTPGSGGGDLPPSPPPPSGSSSHSSSHSGSHQGWAVTLIVLVVVGLALTALVACRELIFDNFPQVGTRVSEEVRVSSNEATVHATIKAVLQSVSRTFLSAYACMCSSRLAPQLPRPALVPVLQVERAVHSLLTRLGTSSRRTNASGEGRLEAGGW